MLGPRDRDELAAGNLPSIASTVTFRHDRALLATDLITIDQALTRQVHATAGHWWFHLDLDAHRNGAVRIVSRKETMLGARS